MTLIKHEDLQTRIVLTIPEIARLIGKTELSVRRRIELGEIPARRWGRRIVLLREEVETFFRDLPKYEPEPDEAPED